MIDTHCHLTSKALKDHVGSILDAARAQGVWGAITVACDVEDAEASLALAKQHENLWCSAGVHPLYADSPCDWERIRKVGEDPKCVAWGELGLDNHYDEPARPIQDTVLTDQLSFLEGCASDGLTKPIIVHSRQSIDELLDVFKASSLDPTRYVFHCFTGGPDEARRILDFGAWISFTGAVTFKNGQSIAEAAKLVPSDRIMVETDSPYMTPEPHRKIRPNEPRYVVHVAAFLAALRGIDAAAFEKQLDSNARRFFRLDSESRTRS
ncbi:MAG: TatD family hydrolase [Planctomycetota bacterium]|nr:TatD family hydrolase [Planctomycetota bacterium]